MPIARLIKTTRTKLGRIDCVTSPKNICENTKRSQANREAKIYRFISHTKGPLFPLFLCRSVFNIYLKAAADFLLNLSNNPVEISLKDAPF